ELLPLREGVEDEPAQLHRLVRPGRQEDVRERGDRVRQRLTRGRIDDVHLVARRYGLDRRGRGRDRAQARRDELAGPVLDAGELDAVGQRVGDVDVADRALGVLDHAREAGAATAAEAGRPADLRRVADLRLERAAHRGQVVGEVVGGAGAVRAPDGRDLRVRQGDARVQPPD